MPIGPTLTPRGFPVNVFPGGGRRGGDYSSIGTDVMAMIMMMQQMQNQTAQMGMQQRTLANEEVRDERNRVLRASELKLEDYGKEASRLLAKEVESQYTDEFTRGIDAAKSDLRPEINRILKLQADENTKQADMRIENILLDQARTMVGEAAEGWNNTEGGMYHAGRMAYVKSLLETDTLGSKGDTLKDNITTNHANMLFMDESGRVPDMAKVGNHGLLQLRDYGEQLEAEVTGWHRNLQRELFDTADLEGLSQLGARVASTRPSFTSYTDFRKTTPHTFRRTEPFETLAPPLPTPGDAGPRYGGETREVLEKLKDPNVEVTVEDIPELLEITGKEAFHSVKKAPIEDLLFNIIFAPNIYGLPVIGAFMNNKPADPIGAPKPMPTPGETSPFNQFSGMQDLEAVLGQVVPQMFDPAVGPTVQNAANLPPLVDPTMPKPPHGGDRKDWNRYYRDLRQWRSRQ